jgi:hypothetical protein
MKAAGSDSGWQAVIFECSLVSLMRTGLIAACTKPLKYAIGLQHFNF